MCSGLARCRARLLAGVSPVRVYTLILRPIASMGVVQLRRTSTTSVLSGEKVEHVQPIMRSCNEIYQHRQKSGKCLACTSRGN